MEIAEVTPDNTIKRSREARRNHRAAERKQQQQGSLPLRMFLSVDGETARRECVHASNPFHKCADHCFRNNPSAARAKSWSGERGKSADQTGNMDVDPKCVYASNPFHVCTDFCVRKRSGQDKGGGGGGQAITVKSRSNSHHHTVAATAALGKVAKVDGVYPMCPLASNPFHTCVESCLKRMAYKDGVRAVVGMVKQGREVIGDRSMCCKNASNPFHDEYCVKRKPGRDPVKRGETGSGFTPVNASA